MYDTIHPFARAKEIATALRDASGQTVEFVGITGTDRRGLYLLAPGSDAAQWRGYATDRDVERCLIQQDGILSLVARREITAEMIEEAAHV